MIGWVIAAAWLVGTAVGVRLMLRRYLAGDHNARHFEAFDAISCIFLMLIGWWIFYVPYWLYTEHISITKGEQWYDRLARWAVGKSNEEEQ